MLSTGLLRRAAPGKDEQSRPRETRTRCHRREMRERRLALKCRQASGRRCSPMVEHDGLIWWTWRCLPRESRKSRARASGSRSRRVCRQRSSRAGSDQLTATGPTDKPIDGGRRRNATETRTSGDHMRRRRWPTMSLQIPCGGQRNAFDQNCCPWRDRSPAQSGALVLVGLRLDKALAPGGSA